MVMSLCQKTRRQILLVDTSVRRLANMRRRGSIRDIGGWGPFPRYAASEVTTYDFTIHHLSSEKCNHDCTKSSHTRLKDKLYSRKSCLASENFAMS